MFLQLQDNARTIINIDNIDCFQKSDYELSVRFSCSPEWLTFEYNQPGGEWNEDMSGTDLARILAAKGVSQ